MSALLAAVPTFSQEPAETSVSPFQLPVLEIPASGTPLTSEEIQEAFTAAFEKARPAIIAAHNAAVSAAVTETAAAVAAHYEEEVARLIGERDGYKAQVNQVQIDTATAVAQEYLPQIAGLEASLNACQNKSVLDTVQNVAAGMAIAVVGDFLLGLATGGDE